jgi:hypothetical protein
MGLSRVLSNVKSGREFLQEQMEVAGEKTTRQTIFDALHSARRLNFIRDCSEQFARIAQWLGGESMPDQLVDFPELDDWNVYAVDGHCIEHASHSSRSEKGTFIPAGYDVLAQDQALPGDQDCNPAQRQYEAHGKNSAGL